MIVFVYSWVLFFIFVDRSRLKDTVYGGIIAFALGTAVDWGGQKLGLYIFQGNIISWMGNSLFYAAGPLFTMGVLFFQFLSLDRRLQAANIVAFTLAYLSVELLLIHEGSARYVHWHYLASLCTDLVVFSAFSYIGEVIVYKRIKTRL
ncbi:MAG: hypothetical protein ACOY31_01100 [Bacillota bacterium]